MPTNKEWITWQCPDCKQNVHNRTACPHCFREMLLKKEEDESQEAEEQLTKKERE